MNPVHSRARGDLPQEPQTVAAIVPNVSTVGNHGGAVYGRGDDSRAGRRRNRVPGNVRRYSEKTPRCAAPILTGRYRRLVLVLLVGYAGPVAQNLVARELKA